MIVEPNYSRIGWTGLTSIPRPAGSNHVSTLNMTDEELEWQRDREKARPPFAVRGLA